MPATLPNSNHAAQLYFKQHFKFGCRCFASSLIAVQMPRCTYVAPTSQPSSQSIMPEVNITVNIYGGTFHCHAAPAELNFGGHRKGRGRKGSEKGKGDGDSDSTSDGVCECDHAAYLIGLAKGLAAAKAAARKGSGGQGSGGKGQWGEEQGSGGQGSGGKGHGSGGLPGWSGLFENQPPERTSGPKAPPQTLVDDCPWLKPATPDLPAGAARGGQPRQTAAASSAGERPTTNV